MTCPTCGRPVSLLVTIDEMAKHLACFPSLVAAAEAAAAVEQHTERRSPEQRRQSSQRVGGRRSSDPKE